MLVGGPRKVGIGTTVSGGGMCEREYRGPRARARGNIACASGYAIASARKPASRRLSTYLARETCITRPVQRSRVHANSIPGSVGRRAHRVQSQGRSEQRARAVERYGGASHEQRQPGRERLRDVERQRRVHRTGRREQREDAAGVGDRSGSAPSRSRRARRMARARTRKTTCRSRSSTDWTVP